MTFLKLEHPVKLRIILFFFPYLLGFTVAGQSLPTGQEVRYNPIVTSVPFLNITPDSRHGGMGNVGVATSPDANSQYLNPSKYAFTEGSLGFSLSYTPWLRGIVNDVSLSYLAGYIKLDRNQVIGSSLRYFTMGEIELTGADEASLGTTKPSEFAFDLSYSRKLSDVFSGGITLRYIHSNPLGGFGLENYTAGNAVASDVSFFYLNNWGNYRLTKSIAAGINLSNIGSRISYDNGSSKYFLPANLKVGATYTSDINDNNSFSISLDFNKLLVPTPTYTHMTTGDVIVLPVKDSNYQSVISSIFGSFTDAPGGLREELSEVTISVGAEYWYKKYFALRTGYFNESQDKGNRKYFSTGIGLKMKATTVDFSYVLPVQSNNPLANTMRITLLFNFDSLTKSKSQNMRRRNQRSRINHRY